MALNAIQCEQLHIRANQAGKKAADAVVLQEYGIVEADVFGNPVPNAKRYKMMGLCGFAEVNIKPANTNFAKWLVKNNIARKDSYRGGICYWIGQYGQSVDKKSAYASAYAEVLRENGIKRAYASSRLD